MKFLKAIIQGIFNKAGFSVRRHVEPSAEDTIPEYTDQQKIFGDTPVIIFDAGAHHGQTSATYLQLFPGASIYAFEPFPDSFAILQQFAEKNPAVKAFNLALGNSTGTVSFHVNQSSQTNSLLATHAEAENTWGKNLLGTLDTIHVNSVTLDKFAKTNSVDRINILKLDTQGAEHDIIEGASEMIRQQKIDLVYLEIIIQPTYRLQKSFDEILLLLRRKGFELYNLYNPSRTPAGVLRQLDATFVRSGLLPKQANLA